MERVRLTKPEFVTTGDAFKATNAADRTSSSHDWMVDNDIGSVCRQLDNETRWRVTAVTSGVATWVQIPAGGTAVVASDVGTTGSAGTSADAASADHVHAHGNQTATGLHAVATSGGAGFMSVEQVVQLEGVGTTDGVVLQVGTGTTVVQTSAAALLTVKNTSREVRAVVWTSDTLARHVSHGDEVLAAVHWLDDDTQEIEQLDVTVANDDAGATPAITCALPNVPDVVLSVGADHKLSIAVTRPTTYPAKAWARIWLGALLTHTDVALPPAFSSATCNNAGDTITLTYAAALNTGSVPAKTAFTLIGTSATINTVSIVGSTVVLALTVPVSYGDTVTFDYTIPATNPIQSAGGINVIALSGESCDNVTPPVLSGISTNTAGTQIVLTYGAALDAASTPAKTAFTLHGTTATINTLAVAGSAVTLTLTGTVVYGETVTVDYAVPVSNPVQENATGYDVRPFTGTACTNIVPTLYVGSTTSAAGDTITVTWADDLDPASVPAAARFSLAGTAATIASTAISLHSVVLTLTGTVAYTDVVTVTYTAAANPAQTLNGVDVANLVTQPVTNVVPPAFVSATSSNAGGTITLTYAGALDTGSIPASTDYTLAGTSATVAAPVSIVGSTVVLNLATALVEYGETVTVSYTAGANPLKGAAGSAVANLVTEACANVTPPDFVSATTNAAGSSIVITFEAALDAASTPAVGAFALSGTAATVSGVTVLGTDVTLALTGTVEHLETVTVAYTVPGANKLIENVTGLVCVAFAGQAVANLRPPKMTALATNIGGGEITLTYNGTLDGTSVSATTAFTLAGALSATIENVVVSGVNVTITLNGLIDSSETPTLTYVVPGSGKIQEITTGYACEAFATEAITNNSLVPPTALSTLSTNAAGSTIVMTYDRALDTGSTPDAGDFALTGTAATVAGVGVAGSACTLTLAGTVACDEVVTLDYTPGTNKIRSNVGHVNAVALVGSAVANIVPPALVTLVTNAAGTQIIATYDTALDTGSTPAIGQFTIAGDDATVASVSIAGSAVTLVLTGTIEVNDVVTLSYAVPGTGKIRSNVSHAAAVALVTEATTNMVPPVIVSIVTNAAGDEIVMTYDGALDVTSTPAFGDFAIAGDDATVDGATVLASTVTLTLTGAIEVNDAATLSYTAAADPIRSATNVIDAADLVTAAITNMVPPVIVSGATNVAGTEITLTYDGALDETSEPAFGDYTLTGDDATVSGVNVTGSTVVLTLTGAIENGDVITIDYVVPGTGMVRSATNTVNAAALTAQAITNNVP